MDYSELLLKYGKLISYTMNIARETKDKKLREQIIKDLVEYIEYHNKMTRLIYL